MLRTDCSTEALIAALEQLIPFYMEQAAVTGLSAALIRDAQVIWARAFGFKDAAERLPFDVDTVCEAASLSKPVFAYLVFRLCESGALDLDRPLSEYLPQPYLPGEPRLDRLTARLVLSHRTGLPNWRSEERPLKLYFDPGARFSYSGEGYVYLQRVVEHLAGRTLAELSRAQVLDPLGMGSSSFVWQEGYETLAAVGHDQGGKPGEKFKPAEPNAAYSLHTTPTEFARFMIALMPPFEGSALLSEASAAEMIRPHVRVNGLAPWHDAWPDGTFVESDRVSWGLGWGLQQVDGSTAFWHWGDNGSFQDLALGDAQSRDGIVLMSNSRNGRDLWKNLLPVATGGETPAVAWLDDLYSRE